MAGCGVSRRSTRGATNIGHLHRLAQLAAAWEFAGYPRRFAIQSFLAIVGGIGIAAVAIGHNAVGAALIFAGVGSMAAAAVVLLLSSPDKARAAVPPAAPWLSCRKAGRSAALRAFGKDYSTSAQPASWVTPNGVRNGETPVLDRKIRDKLLPQSWRFLRFSAVIAGQIGTSNGVCPGYKIIRVWGERPSPPMRWRHETLNARHPGPEKI